jgi:hypothetical protein
VHVFQNMRAVKRAKEGGMDLSGNVAVISGEEAEGSEQEINSDSE